MAKLKQTANGYWVVSNDTHVGAWIEQTGKLHYDCWLIHKILPLLKPGFVCIDAGALYGDHTVAYANAVGRNGMVYAFEPLFPSFVCLLRNCAHMPNIVSLPYALGRHLTARGIAEDVNTGGSHLLDFGGQPVVVVPLDSFELPKVDFIKLDVEGYEPQVLDGAAQTIERCRPIIVMEVNHGALKRQGTDFKEIENFLNVRNYAYTVLSAGGIDTPQPDILCTPNL